MSFRLSSLCHALFSLTAPVRRNCGASADPFSFLILFLSRFFLFRSFLSSSSLLHPLALTLPCADPNTPTCAFKTSPFVQAKRPHAENLWTSCRYTWRRFQCTHGGVSESTYGLCRTTHTAHQTHTPNTHHDHMHSHTQHNTTSLQHRRETERERREDERRRDKTRQGKRRQEKKREEKS